MGKKVSRKSVKKVVFRRQKKGGKSKGKPENPLRRVQEFVERPPVLSTGESIKTGFFEDKKQVEILWKKTEIAKSKPTYNDKYLDSFKFNPTLTTSKSKRKLLRQINTYIKPTEKNHQQFKQKKSENSIFGKVEVMGSKMKNNNKSNQMKKKKYQIPLFLKSTMFKWRMSQRKNR